MLGADIQIAGAAGDSILGIFDNSEGALVGLRQGAEVAETIFDLGPVQPSQPKLLRRRRLLRYFNGERSERYITRVLQSFSCKI